MPILKSTAKSLDDALYNLSVLQDFVKSLFQSERRHEILHHGSIYDKNLETQSSIDTPLLSSSSPISSNSNQYISLPTPHDQGNTYLGFSNASPLVSQTTAQASPQQSMYVPSPGLRTRSFSSAML